MKKLEKLTLKELGDSSIAVCPTDEQRSIVAGSGYWITGSDGTQCYVAMDDIVVYGLAPYCYDPQYDPYYNQPPIDLTPEEKFSKACAEGFTDGAKLVAALGWAAACALFAYYFRTNPDSGSLIVSPTNFQ